MNVRFFILNVKYKNVLDFRLMNGKKTYTTNYNKSYAKF